MSALRIINQPAPVVKVYTSWPSMPQTGPGGASYVHTQGSAAATWTINHNLGFRPSVELFDAGGAEIEAEVIHASVNQTLVYLSTPTAGSARCN